MGPVVKGSQFQVHGW